MRPAATAAKKRSQYIDVYKRQFYDRVDESLVMPESQRHFPEPGHEKEYDELIAGLGGVDMCFGGLGINGHVAFNEAAEADDPITADAYADLGTRVLPISRETDVYKRQVYRSTYRRRPASVIALL